MFTAAITTRAVGFSELDKKCLLSNSILPKDGKDIVDNAPEKEDLSQLLERLKRRYGRPQVVVPLLIKKMDQPQSFSFDCEGVQRIHTHIFQGYDALEPYLEDSLSSYLLYRTTMSLTPAAKEIWDNAVTKREVKPTFGDFRTYLENRLDQLAPSNQSYSNPSSSSASFNSNPSPAKNKVKFNPKCLACEDKHGLNKCSVFASYNTDRRNKFVREMRLCMNCFSDTHGFKNCPSRFTCRSCGQRHHTLLHRNPLEPTAASFSLAVDKEETEVSKDDANISPTFPNTIIVSISNRGKTMKASAILDSGAGVSLMSSSLATSLGLKRIPHSLSFTGSFGSGRSTYCVKTSLHSDNSSFASTPITFSVLPKLNPSPVPVDKKSIADLPSVRDLHLSDPDMGGSVQLILGNMDMEQCVYDGRIMIEGIKIINTPFGWSIAGPLYGRSPVNVLNTTAEEDNLDKELSRLWQLDLIPNSNPTPSHDPVVADFLSSYSRTEGRFMVILPRKSSVVQLGKTRPLALKRLLSNEKTLKKKDKLLDFQGALVEYLTLDHAEVIPPTQIANDPHFYLPVHGVFKDSSTTTKLRPVFDASAKSSTGVSLNDILDPGPCLYPALADVLIRFRTHNIGVAADISKMFREVLLHPDDRDLHRFLLRDEHGNIQDCRMKRVTFGVTSSPFLASQVIKTLSDLVVPSHPVAASVMSKDFYVDDLISGAATVDEARTLRTQTCDALLSAGMTLRKWRTNSRELRDSIPRDLQETTPLVVSSPDCNPKTLGIHWDVTSDTLHVATPPPTVPADDITKRVVASGTARVYDIIGLF